MTREYLKPKKVGSKKKKKVVKKKRSGPGRPSSNHDFETARRIVRAECLNSVTEYAKWWQHNRPAMLPKRPDRAYRWKDWTSWNDFLGVNNHFAGDVHRNFLPYSEAKLFVHKLKIQTQQDWRKFCASGKRPDNIPAHPELTYGKDNKKNKNLPPEELWHSWEDWTGRNIHAKLRLEHEKITLLLIYSPNDMPNNVYRFSVVKSIENDIIRSIKVNNINLIKSYEVEDEEWKRFLDLRYNHYYDSQDCYLIPNINEVFYAYDLHIQPHKLDLI